MFFVLNLCQGELIRQQELLEVQNSLLSGFHELSLRKMEPHEYRKYTDSTAKLGVAKQKT